MEDFPMPTCAICGRPANAHVTDMSDGTARNVSYCKDHLPAEMGALMPQSPAEEVALLREKLSHLDQSPLPSEFKDKARADLEQLILDIEAGRRRLSDLL